MKKWILFLGLLISCLWAQLALAGVYAYITNGGSNNVSVIDTATDTVPGSPVGVGNSPFGVAAHPNGTRVYVTNGVTVSVIDTLTNTVVATIPVGSQPHGVAVHPNGTRLYVVNGGSNTVFVIDTATNAVVKTITIPGSSPSPHPFGVAVHPDGTWVYVTNLYRGTVSVIRTSDNTVFATIPVGAYPRGVTVHPDGTWVYVANNGSGNVSVIDTVTNTVVATIAVGGEPFGIAVHPDGTWVYVANYKADATTVSVIRTSDNTVFATIPVGGRSRGIAVHPDGSKVYAAIESNFVSVIRTSDNTVIGTIAVGTWPSAFGQFIVTTPSPTDPTGIGAADPSMVESAHQTLLTVTVTPGTYPDSTGLAVVCDLSSIGGSATQAFYDNGTSGDATAGDNIFSYAATVPITTPDGAKSLPCTITDAQARTGSASINLTTYHDFSECYMTGGGMLGGPFAPPLPPGKTVFVNYSFLLSCPDVTNHTTGLTGWGSMPPEPNLLTVYWGSSNRFALKGPVKIECGTEFPPYFTYISGTGFGTWNWMPGYFISFKFVDNRMTGTRDVASIVISESFNANKIILYAIDANLVVGGHAAHCPMVRALPFN
jgi:YVTN family beta-propeller protein